ncbi:unnamed protein product, partial [Mesorhabditis belari]|uniref:Uncharacterized protein n=1 Tax=Mesorhabditis belari TaxID=2138241 RepID=A0A915GV54_9BILA
MLWRQKLISLRFLLIRSVPKLPIKPNLSEFFLEYRSLFPSKFVIVSAASIAAKVTRGHRLRGWQLRENNILVSNDGFGSGYPEDSDTKKLFAGGADPVFGFSLLVCFSWKTRCYCRQKVHKS